MLCILLWQSLRVGVVSIVTPATGTMVLAFLVVNDALLMLLLLLLVVVLWWLVVIFVDYMGNDDT